MPEQVDQPGTDEPQEETPQVAEPTVPSSADFDVDDLFARGTASIELSADPETGEPVADAEVQGADEPEETPVEGEGEGDGEEKPDPQAQLFQYASAVAQNPSRIAEVPRKMLPDVIKQLVLAAFDKGRTDTAQTFEQRTSTEERLRAFVEEKDDLSQTDPDAFREWQSQNPKDAASYWESKATFAERRAGPVETPQQAAPEAIQQRVIARLLPRVQSLQEAARSDIQRRVNAGEFPLTDAGYDALDEAIFRASAQTTPAAPTDPQARAAVEKRQQAAQSRSAAPKPAGLAGNGAGRQVDIYDPDELFAMAGSTGR